MAYYVFSTQAEAGLSVQMSTKSLTVFQPSADLIE